MIGWQLIDSAPTNGDEVLGCHVTFYDEMSASKYGLWTMRFMNKRWQPSWDNSSVLESETWAGSTNKELDLQPTHWQRMPAISEIKS